MLLALIYNNFGPYHLARLAATAGYGKNYGIEVMGIEIASQERRYAWEPESTAETKKLTIFPARAVEELSQWELISGMWSTLNRLNPQAMAFGPSGETLPAFLAMLAWARLRRRVALVMMDSKYDDFPRLRLKEFLKKRMFSLIDAALVGGTYSRDYAASLGLAAGRIFPGCDVVDNDYFARKADWARENAAQGCNEFQLPEHYFLFVGRFDEKKNIFRLLEAYAHYLTLAPAPPWHLVLCGSGPLEQALRDKAREFKLPQAHFAGFHQIDTLPLYYGLARCLVVPSSHNEQWGLVVNEAMALGLPVLVSRACGCVPDLVQEGVNGYTFDPYDVEGLARLMLMMSSETIDLKAMGEASRRIIARWSPKTFAQHLLQAVEAGRAHRRRGPTGGLSGD